MEGPLASFPTGAIRRMAVAATASTWRVAPFLLLSLSALVVAPFFVAADVPTENVVITSPGESDGAPKALEEMSGNWGRVIAVGPSNGIVEVRLKNGKLMKLPTAEVMGVRCG